MHDCCLRNAMTRAFVFYPGDVFYTNGRGSNTFRLGFSRLADDDIVRGIQIIGDTLKTL